MFAAGFKEIAVGEKAVFAGNRIFEDWSFLRHEGKSHIGAKEDESTNGGKIRNPVAKGRQINKSKEGELGENDGNDKDRNIYRQNGFFGEAAI